MNDDPILDGSFDPIRPASPGRAPAQAPARPATDALPPAMLGRLLDLLDFGVLLLAADGAMRWANRPASEALAAGGLLRVDGDGRLDVHGAARRAALARALDDAAAGTTRLLCLDDGVPSTKLGLVPWGEADDGEPLLLVTLQTGEREEWPSLAAYGRERRLTGSEVDVLRQLVLGDRPPQIAARRGSSEGTVRSQIKALLAKTGTHGMREVVVEVLHLPPVPATAGARSAAPLQPGPTGLTGRSDLRTAGAPHPRPDDGVASASHCPARSVVRVAPRARTAMPLDRSALLALRAAQFAWPPAA